MLISGEFGTANAYAYSNLNPVIAKDPDGNFWHIAVGTAVGAVIGGGTEALSQYMEYGEIRDVGRVGSAAAGGAMSGFISTAVPGAGLASGVLSNSVSSVAGGMTTRMIDSGGSSVGTMKEVVTDAVVGGVVPSRGASKPKPKAKVQAKPASQSVPPKAGGGEARFIEGVQVKSHGKIIAEGTVDLKPTLDRVKSGGSFPHRNDGATFKNLPPKGQSQPLLPDQQLGYYTEFVHPTPGVNGPGPQRIVTGDGGEIYYTPDHYESFVPVN